MSMLDKSMQDKVDEIKQKAEEEKGGWKPPTIGISEEERKAEKRQELKTWWYNQASREVDKAIDKAIEYGAADLKVMGKAMECLLPEKGMRKEEIPERVGIEMAIAFYALGKVARVFGAFERGAVPSDDCWEDLGIYCRMAQHVRERGCWP